MSLFLSLQEPSNPTFPAATSPHLSGCSSPPVLAHFALAAPLEIVFPTFPYL